MVKSFELNKSYIFNGDSSRYGGQEPEHRLAINNGKVVKIAKIEQGPHMYDYTKWGGKKVSVTTFLDNNCGKLVSYSPQDFKEYNLARVKIQEFDWDHCLSRILFGALAIAVGIIAVIGATHMPPQSIEFNMQIVIVASLIFGGIIMACDCQRHNTVVKELEVVE